MTEYTVYGAAVIGLETTIDASDDEQLAEEVGREALVEAFQDLDDDELRDGCMIDLDEIVEA